MNTKEDRNSSDLGLLVNNGAFGEGNLSWAVTMLEI